MSVATPTIVILESREEEGRRTFLPVSDRVAVILIAQEGQDVQIALRQVDRSRLRAAIGLVAETPHPKVLSLDMDAPTQPPFALPKFREPGRSGLSWVLAWLDAAFAHALDDFARQRGGPEGAPWMEDLRCLKEAFARGRAVSSDEEEQRFRELIDAPMWPARLLRTLALDPMELKLICLVAAPDLDLRYAQAIGLMQSNYAEPRPNATTLATFLGAEIVGADIASLLAGRRNFARHAMIRAEPSGVPQPSYRLAPALHDLMLGIQRHAGPGWRVEGQALPAEENLVARVGTVLDAKISPMILASGEGVDVGAEIAAAVIAKGVSVLRASCQELDADHVADKVRNWALWARLHDAALMLEGLDALPPRVQQAVLAVETEGLVRALIVTGNVAPSLRDAVYMRVAKPTPSVHIRRWRMAGEDHGLILSREEAEALGGTLRLGLSDMNAVMRMAAGQRRIGTNAAAAELIRIAARRIAASHAPDTVRRPPCIFSWDDIVLPPKIKAQVQAIPEHVRQGPLVLDEWNFGSRLPYGRGVGALFSGPSGTGKTMCAQVIAAALGVELMQVEIARCVSKYIGETEKNIDRCFCAAETAGAVLLFDEADALFGKRTEIKDAHDRHANVEVAYLLQRIEAYEGLVILTTNLKANIDPAFLRRLRFVCDFPMPDASDRLRIWRLAIPGDASCSTDVDTGFLARRLPLSGGSIQTIAVNAAFGAAAEGCAGIHMRHVMTATRAELLKNGMLSAEKALADPAPQAIREAML
ncbi:MAG: ATP-binding protein [Hyphomicrobiales bacterium]